jgi:DNA-binding CsgD family transcriptional regulator
LQLLAALSAPDEPRSPDRSAKVNRRTGLRLSEFVDALGGDLDRALERVGVPAFACDRHGIVRWENERALEVFGDFRGRPLIELVAPDARQQVRADLAKKRLGNSSADDFEAVFVLPSGQRVPVQLHTVGIDGRYAVGVFRLVDVERALPLAPARLKLTPRQYETLRALARGSSTREIAASFNVSPETVRNHVRGLLGAMHVHSRLEAVAEGRRLGLI